MLISAGLAVCGRLFRRVRRRPAVPVDAIENAFSSSHEERQRDDQEQAIAPVSSAPLIHVVWRLTQPQQQVVSVAELPNVCPTGVFEISGTPPEIVQVRVRAEKCILCEACWRTNTLVNWSRNGVFPPEEFPDKIVGHAASVPSNRHAGSVPYDLDRLEQKLQEFDTALMEGPALVHRQHSDYLEMLARYAHKITLFIREDLIKRTASAPVLDLAEALVSAPMNGRAAPGTAALPGQPPMADCFDSIT